MIKKIGFVIALFILLCACSELDQSANNNVDTSNNISIGNTIRKNDYELDDKSFIELKQSALKVDFENDRKDYESSPYHITGSYDLNSDDKRDNINLTLYRGHNSENSNIQINEQNLEMLIEEPREAYLVDLDITDTYVELAIFANGPSYDPYYVFLRYTGSEIINLGTICDSALINGHGNIISTWEMVNFEPKIVLGRHEIQNNKLIFKDIDFKGALDKEYTLTTDIGVHFAEVDKMTAELFVGEEPIILEKGLTIIIKEINIEDNHPSWYYVEMQNGKRGVLQLVEGD